MPASRFLVDTSAWILALRKDFIPEIRDRLDQLLEADLVVTAGIIKLEILGGTRTEKEFKLLKKRLDALPLIEINTAVWEAAFDLAFSLRRNGITAPYTDILIAACALGSESTVVHVDSHFDLISNHANLKVEGFRRPK
jgi:predicted nucleic acid-binding protein